MKAKHVFTTLGLALTMGLGVAAGLSHVRDVKQAQALNSNQIKVYFSGVSGWGTLGVHFGLDSTWQDCVATTGDEVSHGQWVTTFTAASASKLSCYFTQGDVYWHPDNNYSEATRDTDKSELTLGTVTLTGGNEYIVSYGSFQGETTGHKWFSYSVLQIEQDVTYSYSINGGAYVNMVAHEGTEVKSSTAVTLAVDDVITFKKNSDVISVSPKEDGSSTKVSLIETQLKVVQAGSEVLYLDYSTNKLWAGKYTIPDGLYVYGTHNNWDQQKQAVPLTLNAGIYTSEVVQGSADGLAKVVKVVDSDISLYFNIEGGTIATSTGADVEVSYGNVKFNTAGNYVFKLENVVEDGNNSRADYTVEDNDYTPDDPEKENTYYIVGTETNWKYSGATEMSTTSDYKKDNTAVYFNYTAKANEEIKVRARLSGVDKWYGVGGEGGTNYVFAAAGTYDIYLNGSGELYVASTTGRHNVITIGYLYAGKAEQGTVTLSEYGYEGSAFSPWTHVDGYVCTGVYTSHPSSSEYVPEDLAGKPATVYFYADFMKVGTYLVGNEKFAGTGLAWNIKGGQLMTVPASGNKFEAVISITGASDENPVLVKGVDYHADEPLDSHYLSWTIAPSSGSYVAPTSVSQDGDGNFVFTENTTFAMYVNNEDKVYFNVGFDAFNTMFLNEIGAVCQNDGSTNPTALAAAWEKVKAAYNNLTAADQKKYTDLTIDDGDESGTDQEKVIAKYKYIVVTKYAGVYEDFIWNHDYGSNRISVAQTAANNTALVVILVDTISVISAAGLFLVIRRRKHN